jgi:hypothetical protein
VASSKTRVVELLFEKFWPIGSPAPLDTPMIVTNDQIAIAISQRNLEYPGQRTLSVSNPANFLKDLIRTASCNGNWPTRLKQLRVTARQRYGQKQVFEFIFYRDRDRMPFPDRYLPGREIPVIEVESLSIPRQARALGRSDEPWLIQVVVSQRIVETHLAIVSQISITDLTHLQMSVKTQPEIDAVYVASLTKGSKELRTLITCEAKQVGERLLEDQIREQVSVAFATTSTLKNDESIHAVLPIAIHVVKNPLLKGGPNLLYFMQFRPITRQLYDEKIGKVNLHRMPLVLQSSALYSFAPQIRGISI